MDKRLLTILCCPITHKGVSLAKPDLLVRVNEAINDGELQNRDGRQLAEALAEALVTDDGKTLYPVADGIPVLLAGEAVPLEQLQQREPRL